MTRLRTFLVGDGPVLGRGFAGSKAKVGVAAAFAVAVVGLDLTVAGLRLMSLDVFRSVAAVCGVCLYLVLAGGDRGSLGLRLVPRQGWAWWGKATLVIGGCVGGFVLVATVVAVLCGVDVAEYRLFRSAGEFWPWARHACLAAPVLEESIYRFVLCVAAAAAIGPVGAVLVSGITFGALHVVYGNPGPDNLVAGFVFAWAYQRSGSLLVPMALHGLGNLVVGLVHVAACWL